MNLLDSLYLQVVVHTELFHPMSDFVILAIRLLIHVLKVIAHHLCIRYQLAPLTLPLAPLAPYLIYLRLSLLSDCLFDASLLRFFALAVDGCDKIIIFLIAGRGLTLLVLD